jgi:hypothetical protein
LRARAAPRARIPADTPGAATAVGPGATGITARSTDTALAASSAAATICAGRCRAAGTGIGTINACRPDGTGTTDATGAAVTSHPADRRAAGPACAAVTALESGHVRGPTRTADAAVTTSTVDPAGGGQAAIAAGATGGTVGS